MSRIRTCRQVSGIKLFAKSIRCRAKKRSNKPCPLVIVKGDVVVRI